MYILEEPRLKKRHRPCFERSEEDSARSKRRKASQSEVNQGHRPPGFWDSLSTVRLSRAAFAEFDRRTQRPRPKQPLPSSDHRSLLEKQTVQQLKRFSRHGGPNLSRLRGLGSLPLQRMGRPNSRNRKRSSASGRQSGSASTRTSPYDNNFEQKLIDNGIYPHDDDSKPRNIQEIREHVGRPRASLSPSKFDDQRFEEFFRISRKAKNEPGAMVEVVPIIAGDQRHRFSSMTDGQFTNMTPMAKDLTAAKPDIYDGAMPQGIDLRVRRSLGGDIVPSKDDSWPAAPNFFFEGKSNRGRADVAERQACYDGALGARSMHSLQNYGAPEPQYDGNAYSYSSTFQGGHLQLYGTHPTPPPVSGGRPEYHLSLIDSFSVRVPRGFREGAAAFRNLRDLAESHRASFIEEANRAAQDEPPISPFPAVAEHHEPPSVPAEDQSDISADDQAAQESSAKRNRRGSRQSAGKGKSLVARLPDELTPHCVAGEVGKPKRQAKPSRKVADNKASDGRQGRGSSRRHHQ